MLRQQQREQEWYVQKMDMEKQIQANLSGIMQETPAQPSTQSVKLQKYTITPFYGESKDWLRLWNQFMVELDGPGIDEISKFNYLLELVKGKPKENILGLPHSADGYKEAKRILKLTYGKETKVHKVLIKELEGLPTITSIHKISNIHEFYNKLARAVRTLVTMKKLETVQSCAYTLMDKLGPVREVLMQKDDKWEEYGLEMLTRRKSSCAYCHSNDHFSTNCTKVLSVESRKSMLRQNKMCYNCTGTGIQPLNTNLEAAKNVKESTTLLFVKRKMLRLILQKVRKLRKA